MVSGIFMAFFQAKVGHIEHIIPVNRRSRYVFDSQIPFPNRIEVSLFVELAVLSVVVFGESDREFNSTEKL